MIKGLRIVQKEEKTVALAGNKPTKLTPDDRMRILANLIIDKMLEDKTNNRLKKFT